MGGGIAKPANKFVPEVWMEAFTMMELSDAGVRKLDNVFGSLVTGANDSVGLAKMLDILAIDKTRFNAKIFLTEIKGNVRCIDFYAFVVSLWKFCCLEREAIYAFVFEIYDTDCDGRITIEQIEKMFLELFGTKGLQQETIKQALGECVLKTNLVGHMYLNSFQKFCKTHQVLLSPVFHVQETLQTATLGTAGWEIVGTRVLEVYEGNKITVRELLALHNDRKLFGRLLDENLHKPLVSEQMRIVLRNTLHKHQLHKYKYKYQCALSSSDSNTTAVTTFTTTADTNSVRINPPPLAHYLVYENSSLKSPLRK